MPQNSPDRSAAHPPREIWSDPSAARERLRAVALAADPRAAEGRDVTDRQPQEWELRPVQNERGKWDALDGNGYLGGLLDYETPELVEAWIDGYDQGARDNQ